MSYKTAEIDHNSETDVDQLWVLDLNDWLSWRLHLSGPNEVALPAFAGISVVTPLGWARMGQPIDLSYRRHGDTLFVLHGHLILRYRGSVSERDESLHKAYRIPALLRYLTHQQTIPLTVHTAHPMSPSPYGEDPVTWDLLYPEQQGSSPRGSAQELLVCCAITAAHLDQLAKLKAEFTIPIHVDVLLDGLKAQVDQDYRKSLLYAAIAVEAFSSIYLEDAYADVLCRRCIEHRILEVPVAGGKTVTKDPIYEALVSGDNFGRLLHERPLYLTGRSILKEQPDLYRRAVALYKTRNKIAHKGSPPEEEEYLPLSSQGAKDGLTIAIEVFRWFGDPGPYVLWGKMVEHP